MQHKKWLGPWGIVTMFYSFYRLHAVVDGCTRYCVIVGSVWFGIGQKRGLSVTNLQRGLFKILRGTKEV